MHEFDTVLKTLLYSSSNLILEQLVGAKIAEWLNVELPEVKQPRVDLLGRLTNGAVIHLELQSANDRLLPLRMAEYALRDLAKPVGVAKYVTKLVEKLPKELAAVLPSIEQIEAELAKGSDRGR